MLIDTSYFTAGPRKVFNATLGKGTTMEDALIGQYVSEYQADFLESALGVASGAVSDYLETRDADPSAPTDPDIESVCSKLRRPFADYVYYHLLGDSGQTLTVTGLVKMKGANAYVEPIVKQVEAWNRMVNRLNVFAEWVDSGECPLAGVSIDEWLLQPINRFNL